MISLVSAQVIPPWTGCSFYVNNGWMFPISNKKSGSSPWQLPMHFIIWHLTLVFILSANCCIIHTEYDSFVSVLVSRVHSEADYRISCLLTHSGRLWMELFSMFYFYRSESFRLEFWEQSCSWHTSIHWSIHPLGPYSVQSTGTA